MESVNDGKTTYNIIDGGLPPGTTRGYDSSTKTINIEVVWKDSANGPVAQGIHWKLNVFPKAFEAKLQTGVTNGLITVNVNNQTKSTYLANMMLHETAHVILDRAWFRQWLGIRDHTSTGLMGGLIFGPNMKFNDASQAIWDYDKGTKAEMRAALGYQWAWF
jgi:hypothetical protein